MITRPDTSWNQPPPLSRQLRFELPKSAWDHHMNMAYQREVQRKADEAREAFARVGEAARNASKRMQGAATHISEGFKHANLPRDPRVKANAAARA